MAARDFDLFVIGAGSGGVRAARMAASYGAAVAVAEERFLGGTCVNVGCIPKKLFSYGAHYAEDARDAAAYGWAFGDPALDWPALVANKDREIARLNGVYRGLLEGAGVRLFEARAVLVDAHTVDVGGERVTADSVLVAVGGRPERPGVEGADLGIVSDDAFHLARRPDRVIVVGGGYIAVEFASIFNGYGAETTLVYRRDLFLRGFDIDVRRHLAGEMAAKGVELVWNETVERVARDGAGLRVTLAGGGERSVDQLMFAVGRAPNTAGMGLEEAGVALAGNGAVVVDEHFRTSVPGIYAIGDIIDRHQLTPVAIGEAMRLASNLYGGTRLAMDYDGIPTAVFSNPPVGTVGLTEEEARGRLGEVDVYRSEFRPLRHTLTGAAERTMMKLVVDRASDRVVGCHMVGADAGEIVQGVAVALKCGATKAQFDATVGVHPTAAEELVTMREPAPAAAG